MALLCLGCSAISRWIRLRASSAFVAPCGSGTSTGTSTSLSPLDSTRNACTFGAKIPGGVGLAVDTGARRERGGQGTALERGGGGCRWGSRTPRPSARARSVVASSATVAARLPPGWLTS